MIKKQSAPVLMLSILLLSAFLASCNKESATEATKQTGTVKVSSSKEVAWNRWTPAAFEQAKKTNRLVLVDFSAEWCGFCKKMDKTTWRDPQVLAVINENFIPVKVEDEVDAELAEKYRSYGRPAMIVLDADGKEIFKKTGYQTPQFMLWTLQGVLQDK
ncbi:MAG: DUF255 domain-containing protein [Cocleimonas sp.]|nr:DUF255 domain-containing protein [Cocleimonas sp.]